MQLDALDPIAMETVKIVLHRQVWMDGAETEEAVRLLGCDEAVDAVHMPRLVGDAQDHRVVDAGSGHDLAQTAHRPITEALLSGLREGAPASGAMADIEPFRPILGRLIPEWRREGDQVADDSIVLLAEAILRLLRAFGVGRGCLIVLEDLHWADADTLAVIEYLADNVQTEPILILGTIRSEERSPALVLENAGDDFQSVIGSHGLQVDERGDGAELGLGRGRGKPRGS